MNTAALDGIVVVDFSRVLAGPYATMMLGDFGADVIKIERPRIGDDTREWGPPYDVDGVATYFNSVNRNKRSMVLDLTDPADVARARDLVAGADIVVENFRPGTMEKLGLGYDTLRDLKPDLIYCAITGFGRDGGADLPGYDLLVQAVGGLMSITGPSPDEPTKVGVAVIDVLAAMHALTGVLLALTHRDHTGEGQRVDTNLLSVLLSSMVNQAAGFVGAGSIPVAMGNRHPSIAPYQTFSTADRPMAVAVGNDKQFNLLAGLLELDWLAHDERFVSNALRVRNRDALCDILEAVFKVHGADHWYEALTAAGVPAGPINNISEAFAFADRLGLPTAVSVPGTPTAQVANPISMSVTPATYRSGPPRLGAQI
ncbi:CoA transferase [Mycolicibacterium sphagni]|uniref:CoA transferase n=1 Tax=Mycolicibacterium sphagni TaxID=1786 RepID=A0ABX2JRY1_9MYCO|nr:CoA transferase [Mycolicibacterium sphagni]